MSEHLFILTPGRWLGEGKIHLNMLQEELPFFTRWKISEQEEGVIECVQEIQVKGLADIMVNHFQVSSLTPLSFALLMENHAIGKIEGVGVIRDQMIGWEFRAQDLGFEGFEFYERQSEDSYSVQGEFATVDQFRTVLKGRIWKQQTPPLSEKS
jgi:hypothetical protein